MPGEEHDSREHDWLVALNTGMLRLHLCLTGDKSGRGESVSSPTQEITVKQPPLGGELYTYTVLI